MMRIRTSLAIFVYLFSLVHAFGQTATVTAVGAGQTQTVTFNLLPKSVITVGFVTSAGTTPAGATVNVDLSMATTRLQAAGVQFTLTAPIASVTSFTVSPGPTATAAAKTVTCAAATTIGTSIQQNCLVTGLNQNTMGNGVFAHLAIAVPATAPAGVAAVTFSNFVASNVFGRAISGTVNAGTFSITVVPTMTLTCAALSVEPGEDVVCTVKFSVAVAADVSVAVSTNTPGVPGLIVPTSVTVAAGATSQNFVVTGQ
jgi:hypothetical protein